MDGRGAVETLVALGSSVAALTVLARRRSEDADFSGPADGDLLRRRADACLETLAEAARGSAKFAAIKVQAAAEYADIRVTTAQRQWLRLRDGKCPFPGCSNPSLDNEADHVLAWARGGTTGITNLGQPCSKHHRLRHTTAWTPTNATKDKPPGWRSPSGRHYQSEHPDWEPPIWPPDLPITATRTTDTDPVLHLERYVDVDPGLPMAPDLATDRQESVGAAPPLEGLLPDRLDIPLGQPTV